MEYWNHEGSVDPNKFEKINFTIVAPGNNNREVWGIRGTVLGDLIYVCGGMKKGGGIEKACWTANISLEPQDHRGFFGTLNLSKTCNTLRCMRGQWIIIFKWR